MYIQICLPDLELSPSPTAATSESVQKRRQLEQERHN